MNIAARPRCFGLKFECEADGLICFRVEFGYDFEPGLSLEIRKERLSKLLVLGTVEHDPRLRLLATERNCGTCNQQIAKKAGRSRHDQRLPFLTEQRPRNVILPGRFVFH